MIPMKQTPLSQLAVVSAGQGAPKDNEFSESGTPFVRAGSLEALLSGKNESELELVGTDTAKLRKLKTYPKGTILFAKSGMSATKDRVYVLQSPAHVVSHLATLIPKDGAHGDYLRLALKRFPPSSLIKDPAYPAIGLGEIENFEIPVPEDFDDQIRIAHLLGKVEELIAQRKKHLQRLDDLLKSVFLEMFGDPVRNDMGWPVSHFSDLFSEPPRIGTTKPASSEAGIPVVRVGEIGSLRVRLDRCARVELSEQEFEKCKVERGDILLARAIGSQGQLGKASLIESLKEPLAFDSHVMRIRFDTKLVDPVFMYHWLRSSGGRRLFLKASGRTSVQFNINSKQISSIAIPLPPKPKQERFVVFAEELENLSVRYQQSLTDLEALYGALSQQAFNGELDLSRVALPAAPIEGESPVAAAVPAPMTTLVIELPETDLLLPALQDRTQMAPLLRFWLEAYRTQLGTAAFSLERFIAAAQTRLGELHPDSDFELGGSDYEIIKAWVFEALAAGAVTQAFDDHGHRIELRAAEQSLA